MKQDTARITNARRPANGFDVKTHLWLVAATLTLTSLLTSCGYTDGNSGQVSQSFVDSLTERQIGDLDYLISIPISFHLEEKDGPDFSVFYFHDRDTSVTSAFSGGMYFGNYPGAFPPRNDSCGVEAIGSEILGRFSTWTVHQCGEEYSLQTIIDSQSDEWWNSHIHAFGHGRSKDDVHKIQEIFKTLRKKD